MRPVNLADSAVTLLHLSYSIVIFSNHLRFCLLSGWYARAETDAHFYIFTSLEETPSHKSNVYWCRLTCAMPCANVQGHTAVSVWSTQADFHSLSCHAPCILSVLPTSLWSFVATWNKDFVVTFQVSSHGCTEVNGNCYIHFIFQMHASSPSTQMWRDCGEANKVTGFNRTHQSSVSIDCAGCSLLKTRMCGDNVPSVFWEQEAESDQNTG